VGVVHILEVELAKPQLKGHNYKFVIDVRNIAVLLLRLMEHHKIVVVHIHILHYHHHYSEMGNRLLLDLSVLIDHSLLMLLVDDDGLDDVCE
jgi:hypothetical protein